MRSPWLCVVIVVQLGMFALASVGGVVAVALSGKEGNIVTMVVAGLLAAGGTAVGQLGSFLVMPPRGSVGVGGDDRFAPRGAVSDDARNPVPPGAPRA